MDQSKSPSDKSCQAGGYVAEYQGISSPLEILTSHPEYTLVIAQADGYAYAFGQRGVNDLLWVYDNRPQMLQGATVADKIIGKAAAALMILGGVTKAMPVKVSQGALDMLQKAGVECQYQLLVPYVENRTHTGRCPIDTICADLTSPEDMVAAIRDFLSKQKR